MPDGEAQMIRARIENIETSPATDQIFGALAMTQAELSAPHKNKTAKVKTKSGYEYSYSYADLPAIIEAARPATKHGLGYVQAPFNDGLSIGVVTILGHKSGQWIKATITAKPETERLAAVQAAGSVITFLRRYSLSAMLGLAADDDDDANAADGNSATTGAKNGATKDTSPPPQVKTKRELVPEPKDDATKAAIRKWVKFHMDQLDGVPSMDALLAWENEADNNGETNLHKMNRIVTEVWPLEGNKLKGLYLEKQASLNPMEGK